MEELAARRAARDPHQQGILANRMLLIGNISHRTADPSYNAKTLHLLPG